MTTNYFQTNKTYNTVAAGEFTQIKDIGLREISFSILLPNDLDLPFIQSPYISSSIIGLPIVYLEAFREFKASKKPVQLLITRILPDGSEIFSGNLITTLETYSVHENALQNGDFLVDLLFREYVPLTNKTYVQTSSDSNSYTEQVQRTTKDTPSTYTIKSGDTLWTIAKTYLNDATLYQSIMDLNQITDPRTLQIGSVIKLP